MQRYIPQRRISQRLILSCVCPIAVSDSTLFFIYTCSYLHLLARKYTSRHITTHTSHHNTSHLHYLTKRLQFGKLFWVSLCSLFSLLLATHWMFHLSFCEVFPLFFGIWFLVLRGICDILEHGRWILHFGTSTCCLARNFQHFTPQNNTNNCGLLVVLAILCCCGCGYRACFLWFWLFLLLLLFLLFLLVCGCCCACGSGFGCSCGW